jgi:gliding motility-associated-like protein
MILPILTVTPLINTDYRAYLTSGTCLSAYSNVITIQVFTIPVTNAGSGSNECDLDFQLRAIPSVGTGTWSMLSGPGSAIFNPSANAPDGVVEVDQHGSYQFTWTETNGGCTGSATITVIFQEQPSAYAGPDQILNYEFETSLEADLPSAGEGMWITANGSITINDIHDPKSSVTGLSRGDNIFTWQVSHGVCRVAADEVVIVVNDMVTPTVITPNEDGLNDELIFPGLSAFEGSSIIIYNRWGSEVYRNDDYKNDWKGKDQKNQKMPAATNIFPNQQTKNYC